MNGKKLLFSALSAAAVLFSSGLYAEPIEIKGLYVGMPKEAVAEKYPNWKGFTIAGVYSKFPMNPLNVDYHEEKLDSLLFFFDSKDFVEVFAVISKKYPELKCITSPVSNKLGAKFEQMDCSLQDAQSKLMLTRFIDFNTSSVSLNSKRKADENSEEIKRSMKDI